MREGAQDQGGFTLVELLVAITLSVIVIGGAASALMVVMANYASSATRLVQSHDAQLLSSWFTADVASTGPAAANLTTTAGLSGCSGADATGSNVVKLTWSDVDTGMLYEASYRIEAAGGTGPGFDLVRYYCTSGSRTVVSHDVQTAAATVNGLEVNMAVTVVVSGSTYSFNVSASRRPPAPAAA